MRYVSISAVSQITGVRYNALDQFTYAIKTSGGATMTSGATTGTALNGFTAASLPTAAASSPFLVDQVMASGSTGALAPSGATGRDLSGQGHSVSPGHLGV